MKSLAKSKGKKTPPRNEITEQAEPKAEVEPPKDQDLVQVKAHGQHGGLDEKEVSYRKRLASDVEPSVSSDPMPSETSIASRSLLGKRKFLDIKRHFIALLDTCDEQQMG